MKRTSLLILSVWMCFYLQAQESEGNSLKLEKRFQIGLSYAYMNLDMKVHAMSISSIWQGVDFGTNELTDEEIDEINSFAERSVTLNGIMLEAGMTLFGNKGSKWNADGVLMLGMAKSYTQTHNQNTDTNELTLKSKFTEPCFGIGFNVAHRFNPKWGLLIKPLVVITFGKSDEIEDNMYPYVDNHSEVREDEFTTIYECINIQATFTAGDFRISAGPGFYYAHSYHNYRVERTNNSTGDILLDKIETRLVPRSFIDGVATIEWTILDPLSLNVSVGVGKDIAARAGLNYRF